VERQVDEEGRIMALPRRRATQEEEEARSGEAERLRHLAQGTPAPPVSWEEAAL
jgi:hypothetical protein